MQPEPDPAYQVERSAGAGMLLDAFKMFTEASFSLETAFKQLQVRAQNLSDELAAKNRQLKKSLREKELVQSYLKRILESLPCGVLVLDSTNDITLCNPVAQQIFGKPKSRSIERSGRKGRNGASGLEAYLASVSSATGEGREVEIPFRSSGSSGTLAALVTPLTRASGERIGTLHIVRDVTEVKVLQEQNKRRDRLAAMGEMAIELAHEIRNPLGSIELFASLLEKDLPHESDTGRWAENIRIGSCSLNNIVSNMLQFANPHTPAFHVVDVHQLVEEVLSFTEPIARQREVRVERSLEAARPVIVGDGELLRQMLLNLVLNSMQALPSHGCLSVATRDAANAPASLPAGGIELEVNDSGLGIPEENLDRIFDPFFTTNRNGTGLGLSVVHQIVDQHSGLITVQSRVNVGTAFTIMLPYRPEATGCFSGNSDA